MNFFQGVTKPMEYLTEKSEEYGDNAVKPALIWSVLIAALPAICVALLFSMLGQLSNSGEHYDSMVGSGGYSGNGAMFAGSFGAGLMFIYIFACIWLNSWAVTISAKFFDGEGTTSNQLMVSIWSGMPAMVAMIALSIIYGLLTYLTFGSGLEVVFGAIFSITSMILYITYSICAVASSQGISKAQAFGSVIIAMISIFIVVFLLSLSVGLMFG